MTTRTLLMQPDTFERECRDCEHWFEDLYGGYCHDCATAHMERDYQDRLAEADYEQMMFYWRNPGILES